MKKIAMVLVLLLAASLIMGCFGVVGPTTTTTDGAEEITSQAEASDALTDISEDVEGISATLGEIDSSLG